jgi:hypothetical protein
VGATMYHHTPSWRPRVLYRLRADLVVVVHIAFIVFVAIGGFLAWRWPRLVCAHVPVVG